MFGRRELGEVVNSSMSGVSEQQLSILFMGSHRGICTRRPEPVTVIFGITEDGKMLVTNAGFSQGRGKRGLRETLFPRDSIQAHVDEYVNLPRLEMMNERRNIVALVAHTDNPASLRPHHPILSWDRALAFVQRHLSGAVARTTSKRETDLHVSRQSLHLR